MLLGEKRKKGPHLDSVESEFALMQLQQQPANPSSYSLPVTESVITEEQVAIVRRPLIHVKREARQRGMQWGTARTDNSTTPSNSIQITEMAEEASHNLPPKYQ